MALMLIGVSRLWVELAGGLSERGTADVVNKNLPMAIGEAWGLNGGYTFLLSLYIEADKTSILKNPMTAGYIY